MAAPATGFPFFLSHLQQETQRLRSNWGWLVALGVLLSVAGGGASSFPIVSTMTTMIVLVFLLLFAAAVETGSAIWARGWEGFFVHLLLGLLYLFVGFVVIERPDIGAAGYTLMLAVFFVAGGLLRIIFALSGRFSGWGWKAFSGLIAFVLGILIWRDMPEAELWVIGTFVGIDLIFNGWSWVMLGLALRSLSPAGREP